VIATAADQSFLVCSLASDPPAKGAGAPEFACALAPRRTCCREGYLAVVDLAKPACAHRTGQVRQVAGELDDVSPMRTLPSASTAGVHACSGSARIARSVLRLSW